MADEPIADVPEAALAAETPTAAPRRPWAATFRALKHRDYRLYFVGQVVSLTGTWMQTTVLAWLAFHLTGQSKWPALISAAQLLPTLLLGAWTGTIADRWPKRRVLLATQSALLLVAATLTALVAADRVGRWELLALSAAAGVVLAVDLPARLSFIPDLVGGNRDDLMNAVALNSVLFNTARIIGPTLGAELLFNVGPAICFGFNALSYLAVLAALAAMNATGAPGGAHEERGWRALLHGFASLAARPRLLLLIAAAGITAACGWPFLTLLPALAAKTLLLPERGYGFMVSATGAGALTAALTVATFGTWERRRRFIAGGIVLVGAGLLGLSLVREVWQALLCCALVGFGLISFFATSQSVVQLSADPASRGRIMGIWAMTWSGAVPIGNLLIGPAADLWDVPAVLLGQSVALAAAAVLLLVLFRRYAPAPSNASSV